MQAGSPLGRRLWQEDPGAAETGRAVLAGIEKLASGNARAGVVFNPLSGRNCGHAAELKSALAGIPGLALREVTRLEETEGAVETFLREGIDLLVVAGGDGMVQAVMKSLFTSAAPDEWPLLTVIPGGTTNMTARDLGISGRPRAVLKRLRVLLAGPCRPALAGRRALRVEQAGAETVYGMFFGAGLIARAVKYSRGDIKRLGITGGIFSSLIALRCLAGFLSGRGTGAWGPAWMAVKKNREAENAAADEDTEAANPNRAGGVGDGAGNARRYYLLAFASTLERLVFGMRPYWGREQGPIHATLIEQGRRRFLRKLPRLLRGNGHGLVERDGYHSVNAGAMDVYLDDEYIVDGELYRAHSEAGPLRISATSPLTFVVL